jgi:hypothetical protein
MGDELPGLHGKFETQWGLLFPSLPCVDERQLIKGLLDLYDGKGLIVDAPLHWETAATDVDHKKNPGSGLRSLRSQVEVKIQV